MLLSLSLMPLILSRITPPAMVPMPEGLSVRRLIRISPLGAVGALAAGLMGSAFWGLAADFILRMGFPQDKVAWFMAASLTGGLLAQWPLGTLSDHVNRRYAILIASTLIFLASVGLTFMSISDASAEAYGTGRLMLWGALFGAGLHPLYSLFIAHTSDFLAPEYFVRASAGLQRIQSSGAIAGPLIIGALMSAGSSMLFIVIALLAMGLMIFACWRLAQGRTPHHLFLRPFRLLTRTGALASLLDPRYDKAKEG
jgi:MFS family permease